MTGLAIGLGLGLGFSRFSGSGSDAYAVLGYNPELVLDFAEEYYRANGAATTFAGALTFARASSATYVDSTGTLQTASSGVARVGHHIWNGTSWVNEGCLIEPTAATNLLAYSEDLGNAAWTNTNTTETTNVSATTSPAGDNTADKLVENADTAQFHQIFVSGPASSGPTLTASVFLRAAERSDATILLNDSSGTNFAFCSFDLSAGTSGSVQTAGTGYSNVAARIEKLGNGWYRCSVTATRASAYTPRLFIEINNGASRQYNGDGTSGIYVWGAQVEAGSTPSSYIPTSGSTATRAAETLTVPAAKLPYSATAMSIQMQGRATGGALVPARWYLDASNYLTQEINTSDFTFEQAASGTVDAVTGGSFTSGVNTSFNISSRHGSTFINGAVDGTALTANTTPTALPDLSAADMSLGYAGGPMVLKSVRMWAADITDAGLEAATV